ncbi:MAG: radical SAM protein [Candidatus Buchananbacteria bacterium]
MIKIIFINSPVFNFLGGSHSETTPLGLMYLAAVLERAGFVAKVIDAEALQLSWEDLGKKIVTEQPDLIGVSSFTLGLPALFKTVAIAKQLRPQAKIIVGGPGPTYEPERVLTEGKEIDLVVRGEAENTILDIMEWFQGKKSEEEIRGITFRKNDQIINNQAQVYVDDLDSLPLPAYHLLEPSFSGYSGIHRGGYYDLVMPNAVIMASRGCPHRCIFCSNKSVKMRRRKPVKIVDEIELCLKVGAKSIQFYDDEFIGSSPDQNQWIEDICDEIIKRGLTGVGYIVQGRCSRWIKLETLIKMKQAGFKWIWWGVESGSQRVLDAIRKDTKIEEIKESFSLARQAGLKSLMFLMVGLPGEKEEDAILTGRLVEEIKPDLVRFHITTPFPGSELWEMLKSKNQIEDYNLLHYNTRYTAVHHTDELSAKKIEEIYQMLVFRYESNKKNLLVVLLKSFLSVREFKKLPQRLKKIFIFVPSWIKIKISKFISR